MKTIAAMLTLGVACWAFGTQAQTFDTRLLSQYDASVLRELYPVCRHTTVSAEQQVRLAERIRQENLPRQILAYHEILGRDALGG